MTQERTYTFTVSLPDNYIVLTKDEANMIDSLIRLKLDYSSDREKEVLYSLMDKLTDVKLYFSELERAKSV